MVLIILAISQLNGAKIVIYLMLVRLAIGMLLSCFFRWSDLLGC